MMMPEKSQRKSKVDKTVSRLIKMYEHAKQKAESLLSSSKNKKCSLLVAAGATTKKYKAAVDFIKLSYPHANVMLDASKIDKTYYCPVCKHYSLAPIESDDEIWAANQKVKYDLDLKIREWETGGKKGKKPRSNKTTAVTMGCFCAKQRCIGSGAIGCFACAKKDHPNENMIIDPL